jgi:hypothetical protein
VKVGDLVKRKTPPPPMGSIWKGIIIGMGEESNFEWMVYDFYESLNGEHQGSTDWWDTRAWKAISEIDLTDDAEPATLKK